MSKLKSIIVFFITTLVLLSCTNDMKEVAAITARKSAPTRIGDSITMLVTDSSSLKFMIKANRMLMFERDVKEPYTVMPKGFFITMFDEKEKITSTIKAKFGVRFDRTEHMEARYAVEVVNVKGEKLETERLVWDKARNRIYTDAFVKISTGKEVIMGKGLESNADFSKYEIREITGILQVQNNESGLSK